ncbi:helix-turn-helix domain-containing protein [Planomonospora venezuelensis]|uniref:Transcriptional regulator with XRE-family HTH domain n=1 Tax=Planomonospora venezuelensis TaxID=1999 RepID=A0A841CXZ0_PLAVE|nr:transcriptional regulator with XRE-family HTH domain [Planomonospora venezuelensis]GIN01081.1 hypothetical protein Pve01_27390 [Planomonospora venezuelensis]
MIPDDPVQVVSRRVRELRRRKGWTAAQLGDALTRQGVRWDRFTVSNLENGKRQNVTLTELLALGAVLDVGLVHLFVPLSDGPVKVTPERVEDADTVRAWVRGEEPLPGMDERIFMTEVATADLVAARQARRSE